MKEKIEAVVKKLLSDKDLMEKFECNPAAVIEEYIGVDLPDDKIEKLAEGIKAKLAIDDVGDVLGALGGLFGRK